MSIWAEREAILLAAAAPVALMVFLLRVASRTPPRGVSRRRVRCPVHERDATIDVMLEDDGGAVGADVVGCSLLAREIDCGKRCCSTHIVAFGTRGLAP